MSTSSSLSNSAQDTKGSLKETAGKVSGDNSLQSEGKIDQYAAKAKDLVNDAAGSIQNATANVQQKAAGSGPATTSTTSTTGTGTGHSTGGGLAATVAGTIATTLHTVTEQLHSLTTGEKSHTPASTVGEEVNALKNEALNAVGIAQTKAQELMGKGQAHADAATSSTSNNTAAASNSADSSAHATKADGQRAVGDIKNQAHQAAGEFNAARAAGDASHITGKQSTVAEMAGAAVGQVEQAVTGKSGSQTQGVLEQGKGMLKGNTAELKQDIKAAGNDAQSSAKSAQSDVNRA